MSADVIGPGGVSGPQPNAAVPEASQARPSAERTRPQPSQQAAVRPSEDMRQTQAELADRAQEASDQLNEVMNTFQKGLRFQVHDGTERTYVEVVNRRTDEVMRTIPPEKLLDVMARLHEVLGMILDTRG